MPTDTKRTKMVHIYRPAGGARRIEFERELRRRYENGDEHPIGVGARTVLRNLEDLSSVPLPGGPVRLETFDDLDRLLERIADSLGQADETAEATRRAALAAAEVAAKKGAP